MNITEIAKHSGRHIATIRIALQDGALHGRQDRDTGAWEVAPGCVDAWVANVKCHCRMIGESLRQLRTRTNVTLHDVATDAELTVNLLEQYERGEKTPNREVAAKISAVIATRFTERGADAHNQRHSG